MNGKLKLAAAAVFACAAVVSAHLPSPYDARFAIDRERMRQTDERNQNGALRGECCANKGAWNKETEYEGRYAEFRGDTVYTTHPVYGTLYWWSKFWSKGDEPGGLGQGGGTSPWVMINSLSAQKNNGVANRNLWKGQGTGGTPFVATWRNGAKGAYSMTHDDIGSMPFANSIGPGYTLASETGFEKIKQSWGVFVKEMDANEWDLAIKMVKDGHEMFNHSMDHTSAADQYQWFYPGQTIPDFDPSIPYAIRGLKVVGLWGNPNGAFANPAPSTITLQNDLVTATGKPYWTQNAFATTDNNITITPKAGVEQITLPTGVQVYVKYTKKWANINDLPADGSGQASNEGFLAATTPAWFDVEMLNNYGENGWNGNAQNPAEFWWVNPADVPQGCEKADWSGPGGTCNGTPLDVAPWCSGKVACKADEGIPGMLASIFTVKAWVGNDWKRNIKDANDSVNARIYEKIQNPGKYFKKGKRSEYYGYPMDAYSTASNDSLYNNQVFMARAGSKSGVPMFNDFFHPYAIDFDAFYIEKQGWTPKSTGSEWVYPGNAHVRLGLDDMIDQIIATKGYMIREFHAVADIADNAWYDNNPATYWPLNSSARGMGGWWGGITKNQLRLHYQYLKQKIDANDLVVYTASEAVKYRLTANAVTNVSFSSNTITPTTSNLDVAYQDEISVIISGVSDNKMDVKYSNGERPRLAPEKLSDGTWSVNFNPFVGAVTIYPGQDFVEPTWESNVDVDNINTPSPSAGADCNPFSFDSNCQPNTSISKTANKVNAFAFTGIQNGQINLRLTAGNYTANLYNMQGRLVSTANINAVNGVNATGLRTDNLAKGIFVLNVKDAKGAAVLQHKLMLK
ncbi:MAG: T9SS type A sorting domain-containing protein [Chitinivibrionia bacterium]|nr:T9SS type A sorting domain-containing protein [Chitinivibrionia bacterium]